jgi:hypothetical protein
LNEAITGPASSPKRRASFGQECGGRSHGRLQFRRLNHRLDPLHHLGRRPDQLLQRQLLERGHKFLGLLGEQLKRGGDDGDLGHGLVETDQLDGGLGEEVEPHEELARDEVLPPELGPEALLVNRLAEHLLHLLHVVPPHAPDRPQVEPDVHGDPLGAPPRLDAGHLAELDAPELDVGADAQTADGGVEEHDIGDGPPEEVHAPEHHQTDDQERHRTHDEGANDGRACTLAHGRPPAWFIGLEPPFPLG